MLQAADFPAHPSDPLHMGWMVAGDEVLLRGSFVSLPAVEPPAQKQLQLTGSEFIAHTLHSLYPLFIICLSTIAPRSYPDGGGPTSFVDCPSTGRGPLSHVHQPNIQQ